MRLRARGITLLGTIWLMALLATLAAASWQTLSVVRGRLAAHKFSQQAAAMAISGHDYAAAQIRSGHWKGATHYRSPVFPSGASFEVEVRVVSGGYRILSLGEVGSVKFQMEGPP